MQYVFITLLIGSLLLLAVILSRAKLSPRWFTYAGLNVAASAVILYIIDVTRIIPHLYIPINLVTVITISALGLPGIMLVTALKWVVI